MKCLFVSSDLFSSAQFASAIRQAGVDVQTALAPPASLDADCGAAVFDLETAGAIDAIAALAGLELEGKASQVGGVWRRTKTSTN